MKLRHGVLLLVIAAVLAIAWWWDHGWQAWWAQQTGTDYCVNLPPQYLSVCKHYGFWSGFGSVMPWTLFSMAGLFTGLWVFIRRHNCSVHRCWRIGRHPVEGTPHVVCRKHHPDGHLTHHALLRLHKERNP